MHRECPCRIIALVSNLEILRFDIFGKRISEIKEMATTMEDLSNLGNIKIQVVGLVDLICSRMEYNKNVQGLETFAMKYKTIVANVKKKAYDHLNHRSHEFDVEFADFKSQINSLQEGMQNLLDHLFVRNMAVSIKKYFCFVTHEKM